MNGDGRSFHFAAGATEQGPQQLSFHMPVVQAGVDRLRQGAASFAQAHGRTYDSTGLDEMQADPQMQTKVAQHYEQSTVDPSDKRIAQSYAALGQEVHEQYGFLTRPKEEGGLGVNVSYEPELKNTAIYPSHREMLADIAVNNRLRVNKTGASPEDQATGHPFLDPDTNDKFRAVHDAFGHAAIGRSFTRHGEEAAFHSHAQMFSPAALPALAAETRAQNSALNYGRNPGTFPEQKPVMMPDWSLQSRRPGPTLNRIGQGVFTAGGQVPRR